MDESDATTAKVAPSLSSLSLPNAIPATRMRKANVVTEFVLSMMETLCDSWWWNVKDALTQPKPAAIHHPVANHGIETINETTSLPSIVSFESESWFQSELSKGRPILLMLTIPGCPRSRELLQSKSAMAKAAEKYVNHASFVVVNCAKHTAFCRRREPKTMPSIELFYVPQDTRRKQRMVR